MKWLSVFVLFSLLLSPFILAEEVNDQAVADAVSSAISSTSAEPNGFANGRIDDIKNRLPSNMGPGFGSKNKPPGFQDYSDGFDGSGKDDYGFGPNGANGPNQYGPPQGFGGPGFGPNNGPQGPGFGSQGPNFGQPGPNNEFGPGPMGPMDFRGVGGFDLPPEAIEGMVFGQIGDKMMEKYGKDAIFAKCDNQPELVNLVISELQSSGTNLQDQFCSDIQSGLEYCSDATLQCESIGENNGPHFGGPQGEEFTPSCPPNANEFVQMCKERMQSDLQNQFQERALDSDTDCEIRWEYEQGRGQNDCSGGKPKGPDFCNKNEWMSNCVARMPNFQDYHNGPEFDQPPQYDQRPEDNPQEPFVQTGPNCQPIDETKKSECVQSGGSYSVPTDPSGCPYVDCHVNTENQAPAPTLEPALEPVTVVENPSPTTDDDHSNDDSTNQATSTENTQTSVASVQTKASPFTGFATGPQTPKQQCEREWARNENQFNRQCQQSQNNGPRFNICDHDSFISQCKSENDARMQKEKSSINVDRICELQAKRDVRNLERYCKDVSRGKDQCLKETKRGCESGKKQLERCQQLTAPDNVKAAIEKAVARGCRQRQGSGAGSKLYDLRNALPSEFRNLIDYEADNVDQAEQTAQKVNQKDAVYALTQLVGLQAEQEKKDAEALRVQTERLSKTIERLQQLSDQVDDASAKAILQGQIIDLQGQHDDMQSRAKSKEEGAAGIFSFLSGLFGG